MTEANGLEAATVDDGAVTDNRATITADTVDGSNGISNDWMSGLQDEGNRKFVEAKQYDSLDAAFKSQRELEGKLAKSLVMPGKEATQEDWNAFYSKVGRPDDAEGYTFTLDRENLPESFPYDETAATEFKTLAHETGLRPDQASKAHDRYVAKQAEVFEAHQAQREKASEAATREMISKWGDLDTESFKQESAMADRAMRELGLKDSLKASGLIGEKGEVYDAKIAFALSRIGKEMFAEDSLYSSGAIPTNNPFSEKSFNLTEQGKLVRSDPKRAAALIRAAGGKPAEYGL